ncbi:MAG: ribosome recycling factor [Parachlamydiaceae bacterium]|nr:ribosome recycling factor [Parachlamydiaceae bacterium]
MNMQDQIKAKMTAAIEHFKVELQNIRTGSANPGMIENLTVEVYGSPMRLKEIGSISKPEPRQLLVTPYDPHHAGTINTAILKANLGITPMVDGKAVRVTFPMMTDDFRKKMIKLCHEEKEKVKIVIRNIRREANDLIRKLKANGEVAEDVLKKQEKLTQDLTDEYCKKADEIADKKEKEISTI